jgi:hypothetical protein
MADMKAEELARIIELNREATKTTQELEIAVESLRGRFELRNELLKKEAELDDARIRRDTTLLEILKQTETQRLAAIGNIDTEIAKQTSLIESQQRIIDADKERIRGIKARLTAGEAVGDKELEMFSRAEARTQAANNIIEEAKKRQEALTESKTNYTEVVGELNEAEKENLKNLTEENLKLVDLKKATDSLTASMTQSLQTAAGVNTQFSGLISTMANSTGIMGGMGALLKSTGESFRALFNPVNMLSTIITFAISNFQRFYETIFRVTRELGTTVASGFNAAAAAGSRMGIAMEAQAATANSLAASFVNLGNKQREQTTELLVASYEMQRFGIGASESVTILSGFQRSLGLSSEQSAELATSLVHTARGLGLTSDAVKGLANNMEQFIGYGSRANEVMKETLEVSSRFGIGTDAIAKMSSKLDSLDASITAANTAARELGVAISPLELLRANPAEKMEILADAIKRSGFEGENARFAIKNLSDAFGLSAAQIQQLTKQAENANNEISGIEKSFRDLDGTLQNFFDGQAIDGLVQFKTLLESAAKPVMALLGAFNYVFGLIFGLVNMGLEKLNKFGTVFGVGIGDLLAFVGVAFLVFSLKIGTALMGLAAKASAALGTMGTGFASMITTMSAAATGASAAIGPLLAFGAVILMIGIGIGIAAYGMSLFVKSFEKMTGGQIIAVAVAIVALAYAFTLMAGALMTLSNPISLAGLGTLLVMTAAVIGIGFAIKMATEGIAKMVSSVVELAVALKQLQDVKLDTGITQVITSIFEPFKTAPNDIEVKMKAVAQIPAALEQYAQALTVFNAANGGSTAQVMTEKFVETMTMITEKAAVTSSPSSTGGSTDSARILTIVVEDAEIFKGYIREVIDGKESKKQTNPGG